MSTDDPEQSNGPRDYRWIETEEIRSPGADFGPAFLVVGIALALLLLWGLTR